MSLSSTQISVTAETPKYHCDHPGTQMISVQISAHPTIVYLWGTPEEIKKWAMDVVEAVNTEMSRRMEIEIEVE